MQFLNGTPAITRTREYLRASYAQRGVWHALWCYCHEQNNGGKIAFPEQWKAKEWDAIQVCPKLIAKPCSLWHRGGSYLIVHGYDTEAEKVYLMKVRKGREYAMKRWEKERTVKPVKNGSPNGSPIPSPNGSSKGHPMRMEGSKDVLPAPLPAAAPFPTTDSDS